MIPGGIIGHEGGPCIILLLVPLGPVNILYLVWGTNSDMIFGPMGPLLGGTSFTVTGPLVSLSNCVNRSLEPGSPPTLYRIRDGHGWAWFARSHSH